MECKFRRRELFALLGVVAVTWPLEAHTQQARAVKRLAILIDAGEADSRNLVAAFSERLEQLGWSEGRNLQTTIRYGEGQAGRARALAAEVARMNPDLIVVSGATGTLALLRETDRTWSAVAAPRPPQRAGGYSLAPVVSPPRVGAGSDPSAPSP